VDDDAARSLGVDQGQLFGTLQAMLSTLYVNDFNLYGRTYRVQLEAQSRFRQRPEDIAGFYVRSDRGEMVPLSTLVQAEMRGGPTLVTRFNGFPAALVTATTAPGHSSGQMLDAVERLINQKYAPQGVGFAYSGQSYQERASAGQGGLIMGLGLILVFLVLAAQYESWSIPIAVLFGLPFGAMGALLGVWLRGRLDTKEVVPYWISQLLGAALASLAAMAVGWALARFAFEFTWNASPFVPLAGGVAGAVLALAAGWWGLRDVLRRPVVETLRSAAQE